MVILLDFVHASGPGGQNVNEVATAAQLRFDAVNSSAMPLVLVPGKPRSKCLCPAKYRFPLFSKCLDSFRMVLRVQADILARGLKGQGRFKVGFQPFVYHHLV